MALSYRYLSENSLLDMEGIIAFDNNYDGQGYNYRPVIFLQITHKLYPWNFHDFYMTPIGHLHPNLLLIRTWMETESFVTIGDGQSR